MSPTSHHILSVCWGLGSSTLIPCHSCHVTVINLSIHLCFALPFNTPQSVRSDHIGWYNWHLKQWWHTTASHLFSLLLIIPKQHSGLPKIAQWQQVISDISTKTYSTFQQLSTAGLPSSSYSNSSTLLLSQGTSPVSPGMLRLYSKEDKLTTWTFYLVSHITSIMKMTIIHHMYISATAERNECQHSLTISSLPIQQILFITVWTGQCYVSSLPFLPSLIAGKLTNAIYWH